jgi:transposase
MSRSKKYQSIPTHLSVEEFNQFVLPHLTDGSRGPKTKVSFYRLFNYILKLIHTGCQWEEIPIEKDVSGKPEIHYTRIFRTFQRWQRDGCFEKIFVGSVQHLFENNLLDTDVIHGDGSTTAAKKGAII